MRHKKKYSIILLFFFINCKYTALGFSSLFEKPEVECRHNYLIAFEEVFKGYYANIFAGIGCVINNPIAYYLRILVDMFAWYFRFSKVKNESGYYKTYYGTELGVTFFHSRKYSNVNWLELNFNILSWLLYFPYVFITCPNIIDRLFNLFFSAIFVHSSVFMFIYTKRQL